MIKSYFIRTNPCDIERTVRDREIYTAAFKEMERVDCLAIIGLRRVGKTVIIKNMIYDLIHKKSVNPNSILYLTVGVELESKSKNEYEDAMQSDFNSLKRHINSKLNRNLNRYPTVSDLLQYIDCCNADNNVKFEYIFIDEISYCRDFSVNSKNLIDTCKSSNQKLILSGTDYSLIKCANEESAFKRINFIDVSYIPYIDFKSIKNINSGTSKDNLVSYLKNPFFDMDYVNSEYVTNAIGVNIAVSLINSYVFDSELFYNIRENDRNYKELVEIITKLYTLTSIIPGIVELSNEYPVNILGLANKGMKSNYRKNTLVGIMTSAILKVNKDFPLKYDSLDLYSLISPDRKTINEFVYDLRKALDDLNLNFVIREIDNSGSYTLKAHTILWSYAYSLLDACATELDIKLNTDKYDKFLSAVNGVYLESVIYIYAFYKYGNMVTVNYTNKILDLDGLETYPLQTARNVYTVSYNYADGTNNNKHYELDMVVETDTTVYLCEIKLSSECLPYMQAKYLLTSECCDEYVKSDKEVAYSYNSDKIIEYGKGKNVKLYVLYTGSNYDVKLRDGNIVRYYNIEDFLMRGFSENPIYVKDTDYYSGI